MFYSFKIKKNIKSNKIYLIKQLNLCTFFCIILNRIFINVKNMDEILFYKIDYLLTKLNFSNNKICNFKFKVNKNK